MQDVSAQYVLFIGWKSLQLKYGGRFSEIMTTLFTESTLHFEIPDVMVMHRFLKSFRSTDYKFVNPASEYIVSLFLYTFWSYSMAS